MLDLVGNSTILDSLAMLRRGGRACLAGWLGGLDPIADFNPLLQMASGVYLTFFGSFVFGTPGFPLSDVPLQEIAEQVAEGRLKAKPSRVFGFEQVREAHVRRAPLTCRPWCSCTDSHQLVHVPRPRPRAGRRLPRHRPRPSGLRALRCATRRRVRLHLRR
ncbi:zinc-binding dehydrogenase [Nonomuraea rubra]|uniref:Zinc-binding dehydrogenase n=1 Tax=Nonomuraea rubra TaxID=46180 RepID=A0A7X0NV24_9ACTN|nr:zinc-binding dehydrogenase [Nonomuraea rubra]MBB6550182.1 hypothetical protein [Nonomuraea rubra]